jgi:tetratricopeptide (TPR) repeat protein
LCPLRLLFLGCIAVTGHAQQEPPLGLVVSATNVALLRAGFSLPLTAKPGDILFAGDGLKSQDGSARFLFCPDKTSQEISGTAEVYFEARQLKVRAGVLGASRPASGCALPPMDRLIATGRQDGGAEASRAIEASRAGSLDQRIQALAPDQRQALQADLKPIDQSLASAADPVLHLAKAAALEAHGLPLDAADEMRAVVSQWPDAGWARSRLFLLESRGVVPTQPSGPEEKESGKNVFALLIGISSFQSRSIPALQFAHADAIELRTLLLSPRGGGLPPENIKLLTNQQATAGAIRSAIDSHLRGRHSTDTVLLFVATHGMAIDGRGYIIPWDADPQDIASTAIQMEDIKQLFEKQLAGVRRLMLYVDVCRAGKIGQINPDHNATYKVSKNLETGDNFFGMLAAQGNQSALEGVNYGGGHGAFSYFLMKALNGDADTDHDGRVTMGELVDYVHDKVYEGTAGQQRPKEIGDVDEKRVMAFTALDGITLGGYTPVVRATRGDRGMATTTAAASPAAVPEMSPTQLKYDQDIALVLADYEKAIGEGRILPAEDNGAFKFLAVLKVRLQDPDYQAAADKLKVALEDKGQNLLVRYLAGEQDAPGASDFFAGAQNFEAAGLLARDSVFLEARKDFCEGRVKVFGKEYGAATDLLERAIRLDPSHAYSYNALGIALLETADYDRAILAFRDAVSRAPYWAYPLHNMALAYFQKGDYSAAVAAYQQAIRMAPQYAYLPYNLGLVYQRLNRSKDAESMYRKALALRPDAQTYNALGYLKFFENKPGEAEAFYKTALAKDAALVIVRHNYAVLLDTIPKRREEAFGLWRGILQQHPDYTLSRLALAKALAREGHNADAAGEFRVLVNQKPEYAAARVALGGLENKLGNSDAALEQFAEAARLEPEAASVYEQIGDLKSAKGDSPAAAEAYARALQYAADGAMKKRIRRKMQR